MSFLPHFRAKLSPELDHDRATLSNYYDIQTTHINISWKINWDEQTIAGHVDLHLVCKSRKEEIILDTSKLDIKSVKVDGEEVSFELQDSLSGPIGSALRIPHKSSGDEERCIVIIEYSTTKESTAIGWLSPEQTKSQRYPYLYTQSQPIHARSLLPCQDTPAIKATYSARVISSLPVVMSALRVEPRASEEPSFGKELEYVFDQPQTIPSYLIAIAAGGIIYRPFSKIKGKEWSSGCWAEPLMLESAFNEFNEDTAQFLSTAEELVDKDYSFGIYDILFLPESFPYGGMENSCLTFATPSLVVGDKSQVGIIAHEIAHSWFGNGIGSATWSHFWLNEGWTTYLERLIIRRRYGEAHRQLSYHIGRQALIRDLELFKDEPRFQRLVPEYDIHQDPDDGYNQVAYEKGANFLLYLERKVGGLDHFIPYMRDYVRTFYGQSITTNQWRSHVSHYFSNQPNSDVYLRGLEKVPWDDWLYGEGLDLCVNMTYDQTLVTPCVNLAKKWDQARLETDLGNIFTREDIANFSTAQQVVFLEHLEKIDPFPPSVISVLDEVYGIHEKDNGEIRLRFYYVALKSSSEYAQRAADWVSNKGRTKYCRPIFKLVHSQDPDFALATYLKYRTFYHPIARSMIEKDVGL